MIKAINDIVIIERDAYEGMIVTEQQMAHGVVISVGPGRWKANIKDIVDGQIKEKWEATSLKQGQRVCFSLDKGEAHEIEGKKVVIMREDDIACVIEGEKDDYIVMDSMDKLKTYSELFPSVNLKMGDRLKVNDAPLDNLKFDSDTVQ